MFFLFNCAKLVFGGYLCTLTKFISKYIVTEYQSTFTKDMLLLGVLALFGPKAQEFESNKM